MALDPDTARRLAYVRYQHHLGVRQSALPEPQSYPALMMLHDAVESMLIIVADSYGVSSSDFLKYWKVLEPHIALTGLRGMDRLNRARNNLKHNGVQPSVASIDQAVADTATFMDATCQTVFGVGYAEISMVDAVPQQDVRQLLRLAEQLHAQGDTTRAMLRIADAFSSVFDRNPRGRKSEDPRRLPFLDDDERPANRRVDTTKIRDLLAAGLGERGWNQRVSGWDAQDVAEMIAAARSGVSELRVALQVVALGIDFNAYQRFQAVAPERSLYRDEAEYSVPVGYPPPAEDFEFAVDFMVTAAIKLGLANSQRVVPAWMSVGRWGRIEREWIKDAGQSPI